MRKGIMGGTFDPIHFGHLECALCAQEQLGLDDVAFVPAGNPSFKQGKKIAPAKDRLEMCRIACADNPRFCVDAIEVERDGVTYTIDTVREMRRSLPKDAQLFFILGSDAYLTLPKWRSFEELKEAVSFAVLMRPGDDEGSVDEVTSSHAIRATRVECPKLDISSSLLRETVRQGRSIRYLTPYGVCEYIERTGLYVD